MSKGYHTIYKYKSIWSNVYQCICFYCQKYQIIPCTWIPKYYIPVWCIFYSYYTHMSPEHKHIDCILLKVHEKSTHDIILSIINIFFNESIIKTKCYCRQKAWWMDHKSNHGHQKLCAINYYDFTIYSITLTHTAHNRTTTVFCDLVLNLAIQHGIVSAWRYWLNRGVKAWT